MFFKTTLPPWAVEKSPLTRMSPLSYPNRILGASASEEALPEAPSPAEEEKPAPQEQRAEPAPDGGVDQETVRREIRFKKARSGIIRAARAGLRPDDYEHAHSIIMEALKLYYQIIDEQMGRGE